jgi:hypothetical protein
MYGSKWSEGDKNYFRDKGISEEQIEAQLFKLNMGSPSPLLDAAAIAGDGIIQITDSERVNFDNAFLSQVPSLHIARFVPASGAATRMFAHLQEYLNGRKNAEAEEFLQRLPELPFWSQVRDLNLGYSDDVLLRAILSPKGLGFATIPKGLIPFHMSETGPRTAFAEHLAEDVHYGRSSVSELHFTVAPEYMESIRMHLIDQAKLLGIPFNVDFSVQSSATDTVAIDSLGNILRDASGSVLFRPGGHGALLANLDAINADLIFIKNIDNTVPDALKPEVIRHRRILAGKALEVDRWRKELLQDIYSGTLSEQKISEFFREVMHQKEIQSFNREKLIRFLDRPLRVCGMVRNSGEPGGGPFWVRDLRYGSTLQIVESAQVNIEDPSQKAILEASTHFNPVDIVAMPRSPLGTKYDLRKFSDPDAAFRTTKIVGSQKAVVIEHPGLWNGGMADWLTLFVEVPTYTFNPVKTVNDLLRPVHLEARITAF